jgi:predicted DCC family thiol-disulfide oxidoreductase YuxK
MEDRVNNYLIYDGECPFCTRYVRLTRLRQTVGELRLINARDNTREVAAAVTAGFTLDDGMLLHLGGQYYHGAQCLNRLALLSSRSTLFNRLTYAIFRSPTASRLFYPALRNGRNLLLRLLGRRRLGS